MKRYVITGILVVLLAIGLVSCVPVPVGSDSGTKAELADTKAELADTKAELSNASDKLERLRATKEMVFGKGLRIFDISHDKYGNVKGEVQNISDQPMERIEIIVAFYGEQGTLLGLNSTRVIDLFPQETAEWSASRPSMFYSREVSGWAVYAIGNRKD